MKKLFQNLIWPAVAGNVAWSFFTIAIYESWTADGVIPRLLALLLLSVYLCFDWTTTDVENDKLKDWYWVGDAFSAVTIAVFAITASKSELWDNVTYTSWVYWILISVFVVIIFWHLMGAWEPDNLAADKKWGGRLKLAGINLLGIITYMALAELLPSKGLWHLPASILIVLAFWFPCRPIIYK